MVKKENDHSIPNLIRLLVNQDGTFSTLKRCLCSAAVEAIGSKAGRKSLHSVSVYSSSVIPGFVSPQPPTHKKKLFSTSLLCVLTPQREQMDSRLGVRDKLSAVGAFLFSLSDLGLKQTLFLRQRDCSL